MKNIYLLIALISVAVLWVINRSTNPTQVENFSMLDLALFFLVFSFMIEDSESNKSCTESIKFVVVPSKVDPKKSTEEIKPNDKI